ncbi:hypothetical protein [Lutibacter sp.]
MKIIKLCLLLFPLIAFSQQTNNISLSNLSMSKNSKTGALSKGVEITCEQVTMKVNGKVQQTNTFFYDDKIEFSFNNVKGFKKDNAKAYPKMSMEIIKNNNEVVFSNPKLLDGLQGTDLSPLQLYASFKAHLAYGDAHYKLIIKITDAKGTGFFTYEFPFKIRNNSKFLNITFSDNVSVGSIFLWNKTTGEYVKEPTINPNNVYVIVFDNISGLNGDNAKVYPVFSLNLDNFKGHNILNENHLLKQYEVDGIDATEVENNQITGEITFDKDKSSLENPYMFETKLVDKKTNKYIEVKTIFNIQ